MKRGYFAKEKKIQNNSKQAINKLGNVNRLNWWGRRAEVGVIHDKVQ